ncbi:hypothetical protein BO94DRAFT_534914 [Aspergillus sclerotioniger CBS 115572]|uniref:Uncharacterized protein n=1 Tax=Aspergillus sclerotioniger CBS 115572 TaxID=1450535 RepID=A0A317WNH0_9EURO|nr:hypothetical protein BO94DRAFT_534914 [Aspergillus sclerotioniger CBS 115572]PWY87913.1 hypothetical protein BO94DRAFT_534914 [Aspergillus sclerotioniger CBS 115572]
MMQKINSNQQQTHNNSIHSHLTKPTKITPYSSTILPHQQPQTLKLSPQLYRSPRSGDTHIAA